MACSRAMFELELPEGYESRSGLFFVRVFIAFFWWFMLLSPAGRKKIFGLWEKGQALDYENE
jgi:hypothetical protein